MAEQERPKDLDEIASRPSRDNRGLIVGAVIPQPHGKYGTLDPHTRVHVLDHRTIKIARWAKVLEGRAAKAIALGESQRPVETPKDIVEMVRLLRGEK